MYKYINFIVLVVGLSIIKNSFNIMLVIYLFLYFLRRNYRDYFHRCTNLFYCTRWSDFVKLVVSLVRAIIIVWTIRVILQLFIMFSHKIER